MSTHRIGIVMNGVTGRMGMNQHLVRSILAIREQGGAPLANGDRVMPDPILVGRNAERVEALAKRHGDLPWTTDLDAALGDQRYGVYFDALATPFRVQGVRKAPQASTSTAKSRPRRTPRTPWASTTRP